MDTRYRSASPYEESIGFARAVRRGSRILVSGTAPIGPDGDTVQGDAYRQARRCFRIVMEAVTALGGTAADVARTRMYLTDAADWEAVGRDHAELFRGVYPAATMVVVKELLDPAWRVEVEAEAELQP
jgi:enamine deaminase RidA (YjgF/YER057c/UK114 family)